MWYFQNSSDSADKASRTHVEIGADIKELDGSMIGKIIVKQVISYRMHEKHDVFTTPILLPSTERHCSGERK